MDAFVSRKRRRLSPTVKQHDRPTQQPHPETSAAGSAEEDSTEVKLAVLMSLFPDIDQSNLLEVLISYDGSVDAAAAALSAQQEECPPPPAKKQISSTGLTPGIQSSLSSYAIVKDGGSPTPRPSSTSMTRKGKTLHLFSPEDIATHTPCSIIHNFLPAEEANALLAELLEESKTFSRYTFQLFEKVVQSPHSASFYVASPEERHQQTAEYTYNGTYRTDVRQITPQMRTVSAKVQQAVNEEIRKRTRTRYPDGKKLKYQSPKEWMPNAAFVNCYDGPAESVGYHSDELTYLGPRAVIGSLSLGVEREFRVRKIVTRDDDDDDEEEQQKKEKQREENSPKKETRANAQGQIAIHLPHNSLLVMHAEMQEEWKHSIAAAQTISPHPISGNRRINITYRWYRQSLHPRNTPRCQCGMPTVLRCVQRKRETRGRYMWMCYAGYAPGKAGCSFFQWAEFDDDGEPIWRDRKGEVKRTDHLSNFVEVMSDRT